VKEPVPKKEAAAAVTVKITKEDVKKQQQASEPVKIKQAEEKKQAPAVVKNVPVEKKVEPVVVAKLPPPIQQQEQTPAGAANSAGSSRPTSESEYYDAATGGFSRTNTNKLAFKRAFQPNPTPKIYMGSESESYELVNPKQVNPSINTNREPTRPDLSDMKRSNDGIGAGGVATKSTENASLGSDK
jgi:hypothetical protein